MNRYMPLIAISALFFLNSCGKHDPRSKLIDTIRPEVKSNAGFALASCPLGQTPPKKVFKIVLKDPLNIQDLSKTERWELTANSTKPYGDPTTQVPHQYTPTSTPRTRLDLNLGLSNVAGNDKALIIVVLEDRLAQFRQDELAITSTDNTGGNMFCRRSGEYSRNTLIFQVNYHRPVENVTTYGTYNIGILIPEIQNNIPTGYSIPIVLDPEVKNNG